ncbi:Uncharacterised protein [Vibrio cholerae]|nr:Uncharacterised protein [Vibrio cholerae]
MRGRLSGIAPSSTTSCAVKGKVNELCWGKMPKWLASFSAGHCDAGTPK